MSNTNSKFPRGLRVLITMAVLAALIAVFAKNTKYFFYSIGLAAIITGVVTYLTYRQPGPAGKKTKKAAKEKAPASEEEEALAELEAESLKPGDIAAETPIGEALGMESLQSEADAEQGDNPPVPLIEDESSLTLAEKNTLVNAVWYRCENPYCKYTSFLSVHHIVEEKDGGNNKLDNLIVLCPFCHDLAHRSEIPVKEMKEWISDRANRWKFKPEWKYF